MNPKPSFANLPVVPISCVCYDRSGRSKHQPPLLIALTDLLLFSLRQA